MGLEKKEEVKKALERASGLDHGQQLHKMHRHKNVLKKGLRERKVN